MSDRTRQEALSLGKYGGWMYNTIWLDSFLFVFFILLFFFFNGDGMDGCHMMIRYRTAVWCGYLAFALKKFRRPGFLLFS